MYNVVGTVFDQQGSAYFFDGSLRLLVYSLLVAYCSKALVVSFLSDWHLYNIVDSLKYNKFLINP